MGQAVKGFMSSLKKAQQQELDKSFAEWESVPMVPIRVPNQSSGGNGNSGGAGGSGAIDLYDLVDPEQIFSKFPENWTEKVLNTVKWNEKKELLDILLKTASGSPKLAPTNFYPVVAMLRRLLSDSNVNVMMSAIKIAGVLACGLRKNFNSSAKNLFEPIISKLKDK